MPTVFNEAYLGMPSPVLSAYGAFVATSLSAADMTLSLSLADNSTNQTMGFMSKGRVGRSSFLLVSVCQAPDSNTRSRPFQ